MAIDRRVVRTVVLKLARLVAVLFVVSVLCFLSLELLPGDPARMILGESGTPEAVAALRAELGLDRPLVTRYVSWMGNIFQGDFGRSFSTRQPVWDLIVQRAPVSLELIALSQVFALAVAVPIAAVAAARHGKVVDRAASVLVFLALSLPAFVFSFLLIWLFAVKFHVFPANGFVNLTRDVSDHFRSLFLPAVALAIGPFALYQRVFRADLIETNSQEFMRVARAKGVGPLRMALRHAFRPSLLGLVTSVGVIVGSLIGASVIVESIFTIPGIGSALVTAVSGRDYVTVQGLVLVIATAFVLINALVDIVYGIIDPRIRANRRPRRAPAPVVTPVPATEAPA